MADFLKSTDAREYPPLAIQRALLALNEVLDMMEDVHPSDYHLGFLQLLTADSDL